MVSNENLLIASFSAVMFASSMLNNIWITYYVLSFTINSANYSCGVLPSLSSTWFYFAHTLYLVWNAVNDPFFGWVSDAYNVKISINFLKKPWNFILNWLKRSPVVRFLPRMFPKFKLTTAASSTIQRRTNAIKWGGVVWALAFLVTWYPPRLLFSNSSCNSSGLADGFFGDYTNTVVNFLSGVHFLVCLIFYDSALTWVEVNHTALLSDIPVLLSHQGKQIGTEESGENDIDELSHDVSASRLNAWAGVASCIGALSSIPAHVYFSADESNLSVNLLTFWDRINGHQEASSTLIPLPSDLRESIWSQFRVFCLVISLLSIALFLFASEGINYCYSETTQYVVAGNGARLPTGSAASKRVLRNRLHPNVAEEGGGINSTFQSDSRELVTSTDLPHVDIESHITYDSVPYPEKVENICTVHDAYKSTSANRKGLSYMKFLRTLISTPELFSFLSIACVQSFDCAVGKSSFAHIMATLQEKSRSLALPSSVIGDGNGGRSFTSLWHNGSLTGTFLTLSFCLPHVITLYFSKIAKAHGMISVIRRILSLRVQVVLVFTALSTLLYISTNSLYGESFPSTRQSLLFFMMICVLLSRITSEAICRQLPVLKSGFVDKVTAQYQLEMKSPDLDWNNHDTASAKICVCNKDMVDQRVSAAIIGTIEFLPKVLSSLAPILVYYVSSNTPIPTHRDRTASGDSNANTSLELENILSPAFILLSLTIPFSISLYQSLVARYKY